MNRVFCMLLLTACGASPSPSPEEITGYEGVVAVVTEPPTPVDPSEVARAHFTALLGADISSLEVLSGFPYLEDRACNALPSLDALAQMIEEAGKPPRTADIISTDVVGEEFRQRLDDHERDLERCPDNAEVAAMVATWSEWESQWVRLTFRLGEREGSMFIRVSRMHEEWRATGYVE